MKMEDYREVRQARVKQKIQIEDHIDRLSKQISAITELGDRGRLWLVLVMKVLLVNYVHRYFDFCQSTHSQLTGFD